MKKNNFNINFLSYLIVSFLITVFIGCNNKSESHGAYFGGKIINPKSNHVILFENETVLDTFYLNKDNTFLGELTSLKEGLYYFKHGNERQYLYLEPKDSLLIRLNTWNFDETLVFSGKGAERNNLLIDCFLESEKDKKIFYSYYDLPPSLFSSKVSAAEKIKLARYNDFVSNNPESSEKYNSILKIALTFPLYSKIENYPIAHSAKTNDENSNDIRKSFYKHRDLVVLDKDSLMYYYAYRDYIVSNLYNKVNSLGYEISSDEFTVRLLKTIATELNNRNSINSMLRQTVMTHFYRNSSNYINEEAFSTYLKLSSNKDDKKLVTNLIIDTKKIKEGVILQDFDITDYNRTKRSITSLIKNKNTVLYFWNPEFTSKDFIASRIQYLSKKHTGIKFIGIKIIGDYKDRIHKLDIKSQYYLELDSKANLFLTSKMPRTILINKKGFVTNGFASLSSRKIYKQIEKLAKK
tara:strand:+ start:27885 stop:29282 length:1398 start_codon:yes stop_codon:yes gene_type:complete